jgi:hypothetical protein
MVRHVDDEAVADAPAGRRALMRNDCTDQLVGVQAARAKSGLARFRPWSAPDAAGACRSHWLSQRARLSPSSALHVSTEFDDRLLISLQTVWWQ